MLSLHTTSFDGTCTMSYDEEFNHTAYVWLTSAQPSVCDVAYIEGPMLKWGVAKGQFCIFDPWTRLGNDQPTSGCRVVLKFI